MDRDPSPSPLPACLQLPPLTPPPLPRTQFFLLYHHPHTHAATPFPTLPDGLPAPFPPQFYGPCLPPPAPPCYLPAGCSPYLPGQTLYIYLTPHTYVCQLDLASYYLAGWDRHFTPSPPGPSPLCPTHPHRIRMLFGTLAIPTPLLPPATCPTHPLPPCCLLDYLFPQTAGQNRMSLIWTPPHRL